MSRDAPSPAHVIGVVCNPCAPISSSDSLGPAYHAELLHVLMLPDFDRADRIGEFWGTRRAAPSRTPDDFVEDRMLRAVLVGMLRESEH